MNNDSVFAYIKNTRKLTTAIYYCCWDKNEFTRGNKIVYHREYICTFHVRISNVIYYNIQVGQMCDFTKLIALNSFTQLRKIQAKFTNACAIFGWNRIAQIFCLFFLQTIAKGCQFIKEIFFHPKTNNCRRFSFKATSPN